jgi:hypothetical protein
MLDRTEATTVVQEVATEVKQAETQVEKTLAPQTSVAEALAANVVAEPVVAVKKDVITLEGEEKFIARDLEVEYLKATMEIQRLQKITEEKAKAFQNHVDSLFVKYGVDKAEYIFDATKLLITKTATGAKGIIKKL